MSILRLPARLPTLMSRQCLRCFSTAPKKQDDKLLSIISSSAATRYPQNRAPSKPKPNSVTSLGREVGIDRASQSQEVLASEKRAQYQRQIHRKWQPGDVYGPHDLSGFEQRRWKTGKKKAGGDAFDMLGINPIMEYKNFTMMSEFMSETGRIKHSSETGLRPKNQRKIAKAIRRAVGLGLMPSVHRHPLVLKKSSATRFR